MLADLTGGSAGLSGQSLAVWGKVAMPDGCPMVRSTTDSSGSTVCLGQMRALRSSRVSGPAGPVSPVPFQAGYRTGPTPRGYSISAPSTNSGDLTIRHPLLL
jgi:hypothetical protein